MKPIGLLDRIQQLVAPDRQIDGLIYRIVHDVPEWRRGPTVLGHVEGENGAILDAPAYTASIDAAALLVPARHLWTMDSWCGPKWSAGIWHEGKRQFVVYSGESRSQHSPAVALCVAALRVRVPTLSGAAS